MTLLSAENVSISRDTLSRFTFPDVHLAPGESMALVGPSGSGKTTLLSMLAGFLPPHTGHIKFEGQNIYEIQPAERNTLRGRRMGFVFQTLHLLPYLTLEQNIALAASMAKLPLDQDRISGLMDRLHLTHRAKARPHQLSQGEQQRAAIARAVLNKPAIIIADEPTSALDRTNAMRALDLLKREANETGAALLVATHDDRILSAFSKAIELTPQTKVKAA